jgi:hypothetical protein
MINLVSWRIDCDHPQTECAEARHIGARNPLPTGNCVLLTAAGVRADAALVSSAVLVTTALKTARCFTMSTETFALRSTCSATLPSSTRERPKRPCKADGVQLFPPSRPLVATNNRAGTNKPACLCTRSQNKSCCAASRRKVDQRAISRAANLH